MTLAEQFGAALRRERHRLGISQGALGRFSGLHPTEVQKLEAGQREPRISTVAKLAYGLGVDPAELVKGLRP